MSMHPLLFIRKLEDQLGRVRMQYTEVNNSAKYFDLSSNELLDNAKAWFLRTISNASLEEDGDTIDPLFFLSVQSVQLNDMDPVNLKHPSIAWMISQLDKDQIESIFGIKYYDRLMELSRKNLPTGDGHSGKNGEA